MYLDKVEMQFTIDHVHTSLILFLPVCVQVPALFQGCDELAPSKPCDVAALFVAHQSSSMCVLLLNTLKRYPLSGETCPDNLPFKRLFLTCDFGTAPSY